MKLPILRYTFDSVFTYNPNTGTLIPKFNVIVNNTRYPAHIPIPNTSFPGRLNLYDFIGRPLLGEWNQQARELNITGVY